MGFFSITNRSLVKIGEMFEIYANSSVEQIVGHVSVL